MPVIFAVKFVIDLGTVTWLIDQLDLLLNILANYIYCLFTVRSVTDFVSSWHNISSLANS